jgi:hypothetical protein
MPSSPESSEIKRGEPLRRAARNKVGDWEQEVAPGTEAKAAPGRSALAIKPISEPPQWAGNLGQWLLANTQRHVSGGSTPGRHVGLDPLLELDQVLCAGITDVPSILRPAASADNSLRVRLGRPSWGQRRRTIPADAVRNVPTMVTAPNMRRVVVENLSDFDLQRVVSSYPMRDFARRLTQQNKPVVTYLHTMRGLVGAESLHERVFLLLADFHPLVAFVAGQPFTIVWPKGSKPGTHTPDFILVSTSGQPVVVDVKTREDRASNYWQEREPVIRDTLAQVGLDYLVWTEMPRRFRKNLENFTAAQVPAASVDRWAPAAATLAGAGRSAHQLATQLDFAGYPYLNAMMLIRWLLWTRVLETDMHQLFTPDSIVKAAQQ